MAVRVRTREMNARIAVEKAERKVIEAAEALAPKLTNLRPELLIPALTFCLAVEALQEVE